MSLSGSFTAMWDVTKLQMSLMIMSQCWDMSPFVGCLWKLPNVALIVYVAVDKCRSLVKCRNGVTSECWVVVAQFRSVAHFKHVLIGWVTQCYEMSCVVKCYAMYCATPPVPPTTPPVRKEAKPITIPNCQNISLLGTVLAAKIDWLNQMTWFFLQTSLFRLVDLLVMVAKLS